MVFIQTIIIKSMTHRCLPQIPSFFIVICCRTFLKQSEISLIETEPSLLNLACSQSLSLSLSLAFFLSLSLSETLSLCAVTVQRFSPELELIPVSKPVTKI